MTVAEAHSDDDLLWGVLTPRRISLTRTQRMEAVADLRLMWATGAREQAEGEARRLCDTLDEGVSTEEVDTLG
ncbi:MAG: hypothetical protein ACOC84_09640 [Actinomycetota bacterium]